jgi:hypothetical protein
MSFGILEFRDCVDTVMAGVSLQMMKVRQFCMAVPWLRRLVSGLSLRRPGFNPGSVHVGFLVDKAALGQVFPPSTSGFPCQFHYTGAPLVVKIKKTNNLHHRVAQKASSLRCVCSICLP